MNWITREGESIPIVCLQDSHLDNIIKMLERRYFHIMMEYSLQALTYSMDAPDGASMLAEMESQAMMDEAVEQEKIADEFPIYKHLIYERNRRKGLKDNYKLKKLGLLDKLRRTIRQSKLGKLSRGS